MDSEGQGNDTAPGTDRHITERNDHEAYPKRCILGTETYALHAFDTWTRVEACRHIAGEFIWTGMDYMGESGIGHARAAHKDYPVNTACCGELDICGFKKTRSYSSKETL